MSVNYVSGQKGKKHCKARVYKTTTLSHGFAMKSLQSQPL